MHPLIFILASVSLVSAISLIGIVTFLFKGKSLERTFFVLVSFATGSLLGAAFLDLLPEAIERGGRLGIFGGVLFGIMLFFLLEKFLYWYHCHEGECDIHQFTYLNLVGDGIHNFIDGIIIASAFLTNVSVGLITSLAIMLHEIPQELGDFGILVYGGFTRKKALVCNFVSSLASFGGALLAYFFFTQIKDFTSYIVSLAAGGFIYIACTDLIPALNKERRIRRSLQQFLLIIFGIVVILAVKLIFE